MQNCPSRSGISAPGNKRGLALVLAFLVLALLAFIPGVRAQTSGVNVLLPFGAFVDGANPQSALVDGGNGNLYGTTGGGGTNGDYGTVFSITPGGVRTILHSFSPTGGDGQSPYAGLILGTDGNFYGTTEAGGANNDGTVFQITPAGALTILHSFTGGDGQFPYAGLTLGTDGNFYGTTFAGGANSGQGTVYMITPAGVLKTLHSFAGADGSAPYAKLVQGADGNFYGTTFTGGSGSVGTVYMITPAGALTTLHVFAGSDGEFPYANLIQGADGNFYGTTSGQAVNSGTVFVMTPAGVLTTLHTFTGADGSGLQSALLQGADGNFYGTTATNAGGVGDGTIFQVTPAGGFATLHSFTGSDGSNPEAALVQGRDGNFYGTTRIGGSNDEGTVFQFTPGGVLTSLHSFSYINANGALPRAGLIQGSDGNFYTATSFGGTSGFGTISQITPAGAVTTLYNFSAVDSAGVNADGALARANLIQSSDGSFYGTTLSGGTGGKGTVFRLAGGVLTTLHSFTGYPGDGDSPEAGLIQGNDGNFYGTTTSGGAYSAGTVFQITPAGVLTILHSFIGSDGSNPDAALVLDGNGNFYGVAATGGTSGNGTVFVMTPAGALTTLHSFTGTGDGSMPQAALTLGTNGDFYGTTTYGGVGNDGTVFVVTPAGALTTLHSFTGSDGSNPQAALAVDSNGNFYGATANGGVDDEGTVFVVTPAGALTTLHSFTGSDGFSPQASLVLGSDGNFYGTAESGGTNGTGTVYVLAFAPTIDSSLTASVQIGQPFIYQISGTNSPTAFNASGLPAGLTVNIATGLISGTPTALGTFPVTLTAANAIGTGTATLNLSVTSTATTPPVVTSATTANAQVNAPFTYQIAASNSPTSFSATGLPAGLSVNTATGLITGAATAVGTYPVTIGATNSGGTGTATLTLTVSTTAVQPPVITSAASAVAQVGASFTYQITATNVPTSFGATGLPAGLSVDPSTGIISGTTTAAAGSYSVSLAATNAAGTGTASLSIIVSTTPVVAPVITSAASATALVAQPFTYQITASNSPTSYGASGLPSGLTVATATGLISGTPTATAGTYPVTLSATNAFGTGTATFTLTLTTNPALVPPTVTAVTLGTGTAIQGVVAGKVAIRRTGDTTLPLTVRYKFKGTAVAGSDYKLLTGVVTIPAGATQAKVKIKPLDYQADEGVRQVKIKLKAATDGSYNLGSPSVAKINITANP